MNRIKPSITCQSCIAVRFLFESNSQYSSKEQEKEKLIYKNENFLLILKIQALHTH